MLFPHIFKYKTQKNFVFLFLPMQQIVIAFGYFVLLYYAGFILFQFASMPSSNRE